MYTAARSIWKDSSRVDSRTAGQQQQAAGCLYVYLHRPGLLKLHRVAFSWLWALIIERRCDLYCISYLAAAASVQKTERRSNAIKHSLSSTEDIIILTLSDKRSSYFPRYFQLFILIFRKSYLNHIFSHSGVLD